MMVSLTQEHLIGSFASAEEAHVSYVSAARQHFGEFSNAL